MACKHVLYRGDLPCNILFLGEGPGKTEDVVGLPFVGRSGKLLNKWIEGAGKKTKFTHGISNLVACRPIDEPGGENRAPLPHEKEACQARVVELCGIAKPIACVLLGRQAEAARVHIPVGWVLSLPHPAWVLRKGGETSIEHKECISLLRNFVWQLERKHLL